MAHQIYICKAMNENPYCVDRWLRERVKSVARYYPNTYMTAQKQTMKILIL